MWRVNENVLAGSCKWGPTWAVLYKELFVNELRGAASLVVLPCDQVTNLNCCALIYCSLWFNDACTSTQPMIPDNDCQLTCHRKKKARQVSEHDLIHLLRISVSHWRITLQSVSGRHGPSVIVSTLRLIVNWSFQSCLKAIFSPWRRLVFFFSPRPFNLSATATPISKRSSIWDCRLANPPNVSWEQSEKKKSSR